jgi:hypothetical protein
MKNNMLVQFLQELPCVTCAQQPLPMRSEQEATLKDILNGKSIGVEMKIDLLNL